MVKIQFGVIKILEKLILLVGFVYLLRVRIGLVLLHHIVSVMLLILLRG